MESSLGGNIRSGARTVRLCTFGDPILFRDDGGILDRVSHRTKRFGLLIYIACGETPGRHRRDDLIATFWPESDTARGQNALRQSLHVLREEIGSDLILSNGSQEVWVDPDRFETDVRAFTEALGRGEPARALSYYQADFLDRFHVSGTPDFESWVERRRAQLRDNALRATQHLAHVAEGEEDLPSALYWWRQALELSPYHEGFIRRIVSLLAGSGNHGQAMAEFGVFQRRLEAELGMEPSFDTLSVVRKLRQGEARDLRMWVGDRRRVPKTIRRFRGKRHTDV